MSSHKACNHEATPTARALCRKTNAETTQTAMSGGVVNGEDIQSDGKESFVFTVVPRTKRARKAATDKLTRPGDAITAMVGIPSNYQPFVQTAFKMQWPVTQGELTNPHHEHVVIHLTPGELHLAWDKNNGVRQQASWRRTGSSITKHLDLDQVKATIMLMEIEAKGK